MRVWSGAIALLAWSIWPQPIHAAINRPELELEVLETESPNIEEVEAENPIQRPYAPLRPAATCPEDVESLTALLIRDLPGYTNRVLQRTVAALPNNDVEGRAAYRPSYVLIAGRAEFEPLDLDDYTLTTESAAGGPLTQVFFTTLSRQYAGLRDRRVQEYHWLFLTQATDGWRLAFMFSEIDAAQTTRTALPPRENSEGSVGKAVQLWLRDCRAGAIYPLD
ncbi:MAG: hypothetical protein DCF25_01775 [Leptolyngbya foveolarum]|uniref:Uncharacterized protein n=1 Tax=Leptolyngbya foveolarum TaxID=47253 RepID=A0A2W4UUE0_9CYAN|nr:MAG: hypothetical protein DCF25_01775 [Leptolyngbya foveolarum]